MTVANPVPPTKTRLTLGSITHNLRAARTQRQQARQALRPALEIAVTQLQAQLRDADLEGDISVVGWNQALRVRTALNARSADAEADLGALTLCAEVRTHPAGADQAEIEVVSLNHEPPNTIIRVTSGTTPDAFEQALLQLIEQTWASEEELAASN